VTAGTLRARARDAMDCCHGRLPLNETIDLSIDERIEQGDAEALFDAVVEAMETLADLQDRIAESYMCDADTMRRLAAVRLRKELTGRDWRGAAWPEQETAATDRGGREAGGAGH
jgi:hypothetical protein